MGTPWRYAVTLPGAAGSHAPPRVVIVHATGEVTGRGEAVYADSTGALRVTIAHGAATPLPGSTGAGRHTCLHAVPLP